MSKVLLPSKETNQAGARLSASAVLEAAAVLDLSYPVEVKWMNGLSRWGTHRFRGGTHVLTVSTYLDRKNLSETLWHELVHAAQAERFSSVGGFKAAARREKATVGYRASRFEKEANEVAADFHAALPLAV